MSFVNAYLVALAVITKQQQEWMKKKKEAYDSKLRLNQIQRRQDERVKKIGAIQAITNH